MHLRIVVAQIAALNVHHLLQRNVSSELIEMDLEIQRDVPATDVVAERVAKLHDWARDIRQPRCKVLALPHPPDTVHVCVVEVE